MIQDQKLGIRVYIIYIDLWEKEGHPPLLTDDEFIKEAEANGEICSLGAFESFINNSEIFTDEIYVRFITIKN